MDKEKLINQDEDVDEAAEATAQPGGDKPPVEPIDYELGDSVVSGYEQQT